MHPKSPAVLTVSAIVIGLALVVSAQYMANKSAVTAAELTIQRPDVSSQHIYGSERARTVIVEFSDYQCPFCSRVHGTLKKIVDESNGQIAWEYRHLPLRSHPLALPGAILAECVGKNEGNRAFWEYTNNLFANQNKLTADYLESLALDSGLSADQIATCKEDPTIATVIDNDQATASALGGQGTPFSVILFPDDSFKTVSGAVPYEEWKNIIASSYE